MTEQDYHKPAFCRRLTFIAAGWVLFGVPTAFCQSIAPPQGRAASPAFDVASIRPSNEQAGSYLRFLPGGRFSGMSWIKQIIEIAYGVDDYQVTGGPEWLKNDRYYIEAKTEKTDATKEEMTVMLQSLLADRFKLRVRQEMREFPVYDLMVNKGGPKLKPLAKGEDHCTGDNSVRCGLTSPAQLARFLTEIVGRPVMDKTGIEGRYDVLVDFDTYAYMGGTPPAGYDKPSLESVLEEQLGLRLVAGKKSLPVYVVQSVERPTEN
jgi:uncharacterized protein (TIGR03435 family)